MGAGERLQKELEDKTAKVRNARQVPSVTRQDKADLKLLERECPAEPPNARRSSEGKSEGAESKESSNLSDRMDKKLDAALKDSFPGSDPVSFLEAAPVNEGDRDLAPVKDGDQPPAVSGKKGRKIK